jgi:uncharacterized membrane protein YvlD (DUF360 family)
MSIVGLLIALIIACLILWAVQSLLSAFSVPEPFRTVVWVALVVVCVLWLLSETFGIPRIRIG